MEFNNPASRLHSILVALKAADVNQATSVVLAKCFNVEQRPKDLMHAIVQFHDLVKEVSEYAAKTNLPAGPLARYIPQIESAVAYTNLDVAWASYKDRITSECLVTLEMIAQIDGVPQDYEVPLEELKALEESVTELFDQVESETGLDKEFKFFVLSQIEKIRRAISEYRISGASGFSHYIESLMIEFIKNKNTIEKVKDSNSGAYTKFKKILKKVASFAGCTKDGLKALKNIKEAYHEGTTLFLDIDINSQNGSEMPELGSPDNITMA